MTHDKIDFIRLCINCNVLKFGKFTLKSGRVSPYFFNAGNFYTANSLSSLGKYYAELIIKSKVSYQHIFGPAYKGLPIATATAVALAEQGVNPTVTFNRKEIKDHGEGGTLIGAPLSGDTIIIDDVISAGTAFRESQNHIIENGGNPKALFIALDRKEKGTGEISAISEIRKSGIEVYSIITLDDLISYLAKHNSKEHLNELQAYQNLYGAD